MKKILLSAMLFGCALAMEAQPGGGRPGGGFGGFGGFQAQQVKLETSQEWKDVN